MLAVVSFLFLQATSYKLQAAFLLCFPNLEVSVVNFQFSILTFQSFYTYTLGTRALMEVRIS
jgi:hypothetical protein